MATVVACTLLASTFAQPIGSVPKPVPNPARPKPYFNWDYIPLAFHGANRTGVYNKETVELLAKHYQMFTIEKWRVCICSPLPYAM